MQLFKQKLSLGQEEVGAYFDKYDLVDLFTIGVCPNCGNEQVIWSHGVTRCPECKKPIAPCNVCMDEIGDCDYSRCPYGCNGTDEDLCKRVTMPDIFEEDAELLYPFL